MIKKTRVMFLSTNNSCRSQMAEGFAKNYFPLQYQIYSAGIVSGRIDENAIRVMAEIGIDISGNYSKTIDSYTGIPMNYLISVCANASENCPYYSATSKVIHKPFNAPISLSKLTDKPEVQLNFYRHIRDEIKNYIIELQNILEEQNMLCKK